MLHYSRDSIRKAETTFPIRMRVRTSFEDINDALARASHWLSSEPESRRFGITSAIGVCTIYFLRLEDAIRFLSEAPKLILESGVAHDDHETGFDRPLEVETRTAELSSFESMSRVELIELRQQLDRVISTAGERDRQRALKAAEDVVREHGFTLADLAPQAGKRRSGDKRGSRSTANSSSATFKAKYRNPDQTWSGRGPRAQ